MPATWTNGPSASTAKPTVSHTHPARGRNFARQIARAMTASATRLSDAVYSTKIRRRHCLRIADSTRDSG